MDVVVYVRKLNICIYIGREFEGGKARDRARHEAGGFLQWRLGGILGALGALLDALGALFDALGHFVTLLSGFLEVLEASFHAFYCSFNAELFENSDFTQVKCIFLRNPRLNT